jgi:hypothetical protein
METRPNLDSFRRGGYTIESLITFLLSHEAALFSRSWQKAACAKTKEESTEFEHVIFQLTEPRDFDGFVRIVKPAKEDIEAHTDEFILDIKQNLGPSESVSFRCTVSPGTMIQSEHPARIIRHTQIHQQMLNCWKKAWGFDPFDL